MKRFTIFILVIALFTVIIVSCNGKESTTTSGRSDTVTSASSFSATDTEGTTKGSDTTDKVTTEDGPEQIDIDNIDDDGWTDGWN